MKPKIILCTGGAKSGKSAFAEKLALAQKGQKLYIATSEIYDEEIAEKVKRHQERRGPEWINKDCPNHLAAKWKELVEGAQVILIDCITMYLINELMNYDNFSFQETKDAYRYTVHEEFKSLLEAIGETEDKIVIFVTNELGAGIVPGDHMTRAFRDVAGEINQIVAAAADEVYLSVCGVTIELKEREVQIGG